MVFARTIACACAVKNDFGCFAEALTQDPVVKQPAYTAVGEAAKEENHQNPVVAHPVWAMVQYFYFHVVAQHVSIMISKSLSHAINVVVTSLFVSSFAGIHLLAIICSSSLEIEQSCVLF